MREVKFKVYDFFTVDKSIRLVGYEQLNENGNWEYKRENRNEYILGTISDNQGNVTFTRLQYTGLKDKNGVEIYEGDIVKTGNGIGYIEYMESYFRIFRPFVFSTNLCNETSKGLDEKNFVEVIGNICENFKLLKGE